MLVSNLPYLKRRRAVGPFRALPFVASFAKLAPLWQLCCLSPLH